MCIDEPGHDATDLFQEQIMFFAEIKTYTINSGGYNIYACDLEEIITRHDAVNAAAVIAVPHEKWGETPLAAVILQQPGSISAEALRDWINANVSAKFQRVQDVFIMEEFPRNVAGKTLKRVMRDEHST